MLFWGAIGLLLAVFAAIAALVWRDVRRSEHRHWLDALKSWQQLIGGVLGFLSAAGVLVISTALQTDADERKAAEAAHAIGLGLAYEVQAIGVGLKAAMVVGHADLASADPGANCAGYANALRQVEVTATPVYAAVLPRMVDFGETNLHDFVTFYALYGNLFRRLDNIATRDCTDTAHAGDWLIYMVSQVDSLMDYYASIAANYGIAGPDLGVPSPGATAPNSSSPSAPAGG